jgi:hypothetical protein
MLPDHKLIDDTLNKLSDLYRQFLEDNAEKHDAVASFGVALVDFTASVMYSISETTERKDKDTIIEQLIETFTIDLRNVLNTISKDIQNERQN